MLSTPENELFFINLYEGSLNSAQINVLNKLMFINLQHVFDHMSVRYALVVTILDINKGLLQQSSVQINRGLWPQSRVILGRLSRVVNLLPSFQIDHFRNI